MISRDKRYGKRSFLKLRVFSGQTLCGDFQLPRYLAVNWKRVKLSVKIANSRRQDEVVEARCVVVLAREHNTVVCIARAVHITKQTRSLAQQRVRFKSAVLMYKATHMELRRHT